MRPSLQKLFDAGMWVADPPAWDTTFDSDRLAKTGLSKEDVEADFADLFVHLEQFSPTKRDPDKGARVKIDNPERYFDCIAPLDGKGSGVINLLTSTHEPAWDTLSIVHKTKVVRDVWCSGVLGLLASEHMPKKLATKGYKVGAVESEHVAGTGLVEVTVTCLRDKNDQFVFHGECPLDSFKEIPRWAEDANALSSKKLREDAEALEPDTAVETVPQEISTFESNDLDRVAAALKAGRDSVAVAAEVISPLLTKQTLADIIQKPVIGGEIAHDDEHGGVLRILLADGITQSILLSG